MMSGKFGKSRRICLLLSSIAWKSRWKVKKKVMNYNVLTIIGVWVRMFEWKYKKVSFLFYYDENINKQGKNNYNNSSSMGLIVLNIYKQVLVIKFKCYFPLKKLLNPSEWVLVVFKRPKSIKYWANLSI